MGSVPYKDADLTDSVAWFAEKITPAKERWEYCLTRASYTYVSKKYGPSESINGRTIPVVSRILGVNETRVKLCFMQLGRMGFEEAREHCKSRRSYSLLGDWFAVGPLQAWQIGHLYFARVKTHPHVVKIGFSRRVRQRIDDIESKVKADLFVEKGQLRVGTLADEHWWHKNWREFNISGEWFFDPHMSDRTLPAFLMKQEEAA